MVSFLSKNFTWEVGDGEAYYIESGVLGDSLFQEIFTLTSEQLLEKLSKNDYYTIFADLKAFPVDDDIDVISTYEQFVKSACQFVLLLVDSSYVTIYAKDEELIEQIFLNAKAFEYENVEYITARNNARTTLIAF